MEKQNIGIIRIKEGEEILVKDTERIFNKIIIFFPNTKKEMPVKVQEVYKIQIDCIRNKILVEI